MRSVHTVTEDDILTDIVSPDRPDMNPKAARAVLDLTLSSTAKKQVSQLLRKNNRGTITAEERMALERYLRVGLFLDLLHAKARLSLRRSKQSN